MRNFSHVFEGRLRNAYVVAALGMTLLLFAATASGQTLSTIYSFTGTPDGANPFQTNLVDVNGTFYSVSYAGGKYGFGTIFKITSAGKEQILYNFTGGTDGANPNAGLWRDKSGNFYGTTYAGGDSSCTFLGTSGCGVVFELSATKKYSVLYTFTGSSDGAYPQGVVMDRSGNLYGPAFYGGDTTCFAPFGCGVVFKLTKSANWTESALHTFEFDANGAVPQGFLTISGSTLYGANIYGGNLSDCTSNLGCGVIFKISTSTGAETILYTFTGGTDGSGATGALILDSKGYLYGTTAGGGDLSCTISQYFTGCGVVFKISPAGKEQVLHAFTGMPIDGAEPFLGVVLDNGNLYGTTGYGGTSNVGTIYEIPAGAGAKEQVIYSFTGGTDGAGPTSSLTLDSTGNLWSTTYSGGDLSCNPPTGCGTLFEWIP